MHVSDGSSAVPASGSGSGHGGSSPFDAIRHTDRFGREYWSAREMQPLMSYQRWEDFKRIVERAKRSAANSGHDAEQGFSAITENLPGGTKPREDFKLTRFAAYLVAMNGDPNKPEVAAAQAYFATKTREAELGFLEVEEVRQTALARAREMVDYKLFRDMMAENAPDYEPSSPATRIFFGAMQNRLYRHLTGMSAEEIKNAREMYHWPGREEGKSEPGPKNRHRKVAKNYLTVQELQKLDRLVARLCLHAEDLAEDGRQLTLDQWAGLVDNELELRTRSLAA